MLLYVLTAIITIIVVSNIINIIIISLEQSSLLKNIFLEEFKEPKQTEC